MVDLATHLINRQTNDRRKTIITNTRGTREEERGTQEAQTTREATPMAQTTLDVLAGEEGDKDEPTIPTMMNQTTIGGSK